MVCEILATTVESVGFVAFESGLHFFYDTYPLLLLSPTAACMIGDHRIS